MSDIKLGIVITTDGSKAKAELTSLSGAVNKLGTQSKTTSNDLAKTQESIKGIGSAASVAKTAIASMAAAFSVRELIGVVDGYANLSARLKLVSGSTQELIRAQSTLLASSQNNMTPLADTVQLYSRLAYAIRDMGRSQADALTVTDLLGKALRISGASAGEMSSVLTQLSQALGSGVLRGEEFNSLRENGQRALRAIADGLGVTVGQLKNMADEGKLTSDVVTQALLSQGDTLRREYQQLPVTIAGAFQQINNALTAYIGSADQANGSSREFASALSLIATNLNAILDPLAKVITTVARIEIGGWQNFREILHEINLNLRDMVGLAGAGSPLDEETKRLMRYGSGQATLNEIAGPPPAAQVAQQKFFDGVNRNAQAATGSVNGLNDALKKSGQEMVAAATQAYKLNADKQAVVAEIVRVAEKNGFDPALLLSIAKTESSFNRLAKASTTTASGIFQFVKGTRERFGLQDPFNVEQSTIAAIKYLRSLEDQFGNTRTAVSAYYSGEGAIAKNGNKPDAKGANYAATVAKNMALLNDALGLAGKSWDSYKDKVDAAAKAYQSLKLHQDDSAKAAEEYAAIQTAKIKTNLAALKAEEEAQKQVTAAQLASAKTIDEKQAIIASAAQQSAAFHDSEKSLILAEIALQQKALEAKRAAYVNELKGAQSGQYNQTADDELAIKQAIRAVDTDLAQLAETKRQAEISAGAEVNAYTQQNLALKAQEQQSLQQLTAEYQKQQGILSQLQSAAAGGATAEQLANLNNVLQSMPTLDMYSQETIAKATELNAGIAETANQIKNLQTVDQKFAEEQLRLNAAFEDGVKQAQLFATHATEAFGKAGEGIGKMAIGIAQFFQQSYQADRDLGNELKDAQEKFSKGQIKDTERVKRELTARDKAATKSAQYQIGLFGDITDAAKGYFKEGSKGYQALENATKVFRAFEMAMALKSMITQVMGIETVTAANAAAAPAQMATNFAVGQSNAAPAVAKGAAEGGWVGAITMAALMAALGFAVAGAAMGGGKKPEGYEDRQKSQGTGTVLGDPTAQSTSIEDALTVIRDNSSNDLNYSAAMLAALQNIETALAGASAAIFTDVIPSIMGAISRSGMSFEKNQWGPFEYTQKSITDMGIMAVKQSLTTILIKGFEGLEYVDITKKFNTLFGASYSTKEYTQKMGSETASQFTMVIRNMVDALKAGGAAFGLSAKQITARLQQFQVDIGRVSLQGLNGEDAKKAISAVFGKLYDGMADALNLGLDKFKQVGEGSATTFFRVAEAANRAKGELAQLGVSMVRLGQLTNKRGQIDTELFKQSYLASGKASQGMAEFIDRINGTAQELKESVLKFIDAENLLKTANLNPAALQGNASGQSALIDRVGGLDNLLGLLQEFNDNFLTESQRFAGDIQQLAEQFGLLGVAMPASKEGFADLLKGIDQTTDSGKKLFAALLQLNPAFAELADQIQGIKDKYADILDPFGKFGAQIKTIAADFKILMDNASAPMREQLSKTQGERDMFSKSRQRLVTEADAAKAEMARLEAETNPKKRKKNVKRINELRGIISEAEELIFAYDGALQSLDESIASIVQQIKDSDQSQLKDAGKVMADALGKIFAEIQAQVEAAQQKMEAARDFQIGMATQIASLGGPQTTAALMSARAAEATQAVDDYWAAMSAGTTRNTDEELRLLGNAKQAVMDKYNAELAALQQLQQALDGFNNAITSIKSQIATLQGQGAVAALAGQNYTQAFANLDAYQTSLQVGGITNPGANRDYAKEVTLIQAAQQAVMDKYNAEVALAQQATQEQTQALQDNLQTQIEAINTATQATVDGINTATEARVTALNAELEAQTQAAQKAHDATLKGLQTQLDAAQKLTAAYKQIADYAKAMKLGNLTNLSPEAKLAEAQRQYQDTLAKAQGGDAEAAGKLSSASDAYLETARAYYGSGTQYSNIFDGVQAAMTSVGGLDGGNPDSIQAHIDALNESFQTSQDALRKTVQEQIAATQQAAQDQIKAAQDASAAQIKALQEGVAQQVKDLNDPEKNLALKALKDAAIADLQRLQGIAEEAKKGAEIAANAAAALAEQYKTDTLNALKAIADKADDTAAEAKRQYDEAKITAKDQFDKAYKAATDSLEKLGLIGGFTAQQVAALTLIARQTNPGWKPPAFAQGGYAQAGMALVGEQGPELVRFERPAQVLTASQTREALSGDSPKTFAALEAIKDELKAIVVTQSNANPQLIERLAGIEDRLNKMERNQRLNA